MILHLGRDVSVFAKDVVMILDAPCAILSQKTRQTVEKTRQSGHYFHLCQGEPKSFVFVQRGNEAPALYTSGISAGTLRKRCCRPARLGLERNKHAGKR